MPRKTSGRRRYSRKRKTYKRKSYRKRRGITRTGPGRIVAATNNQTGLGMPTNKIVRMRYADGIMLTIPTGGTFNEALWNASSIYRPRYPTGGHQPLGHDQWAFFYNHYVVLGCTATVTISHVLGLPGRAIACCLMVDDGVTSQPLWQPVVETGRCAWTLINPGSSIGSEHNQKSLKAYFSTKKFFNLKDVADNLDRLGSVFEQNPADGAFFRVLLGTADNLTANQDTSFEITVTLDYTVLLSEPKDLPISNI